MEEEIKKLKKLISVMEDIDEISFEIYKDKCAIDEFKLLEDDPDYWNGKLEKMTNEVELLKKEYDSILLTLKYLHKPKLSKHRKILK